MEREHFYPRTPCGVRPYCISRFSKSSIFLSTYPVRGTTGRKEVPRVVGRDFYPRTPCGVRPERPVMFAISRAISIHVPRAGYDSTAQTTSSEYTSFLSTYPVRGTTKAALTGCRCRMYFYPRTPCGVRQGVHESRRQQLGISIHVPRAGYDNYRMEEFT